jgi:DNA (cytosine-5)-methyltransferase 1
MSADVVSLFAGVGGIDLGMSRGDNRLRTILFVEIHPDAQKVLQTHFPDVPIHADVCTLERLPPTTKVVTAGSPCCDFSVSNHEKLGLEGKKSGLLREVFRLLGDAPHVEHFVLENVANMLHLHGGAAMEELGRALLGMGFSYAFRVVDSRSFGLRQRRRRLICVARRGDRAPSWLLASSMAPPPEDKTSSPKEFCSFSWVDGNRGCSFVVDWTPTIRAHDTPLYMKSQPAVIVPATGHVGILSCEDGEMLQGFPRGWTSSLPDRRRFARIGNAVSVPVFVWVGAHLLSDELPHVAPVVEARPRARRPTAGLGDPRAGGRRVEGVTEWPQLPSLWADAPLAADPLSQKAIRGFLSRADKGKSGMPSWALDLLRSKVQ